MPCTDCAQLPAHSSSQQAPLECCRTSAGHKLEAGVADGGVAREDAVALQALIVGARDLVEAGQRASQAHVVVDGHPRVVARPVVVEEVPRTRVLRICHNRHVSISITVT